MVESRCEMRPHARRPRTSTNETNILTIRDMIERDRRLTMWENVRVPKQLLPMILVTEKCQQGEFLASRRKTGKQTVLRCAKDSTRYRTEGTIFWNTLSSVIRFGCIITSRSLTRQARSGETSEKQHRGSQDSPSARKVLAKFLGLQRHIVRWYSPRTTYS